MFSSLFSENLCSKKTQMRKFYPYEHSVIKHWFIATLAEEPTNVVLMIIRFEVPKKHDRWEFFRIFGPMKVPI